MVISRKLLYDVSILVLFFLLLFMGLIGFYLYRQQRDIAQHLADIQNTHTELAQQIDIPQQIVEKVVSKTVLWRPIQEQVQDTVVQVFAQIAEFDILQPYLTPHQYAAYGSGFFINADGDLITNAHVINQARSVWIQIPSLGRRIIDVEVVGMTPDRDIALLRLKPEGKKLIMSALGSIPFLPLGDSDTVHRADEVLALGYPLGQQSLKSTTGVVSGREQHMLQIDAAINPGSSGGPLLNEAGQVIGINSSGIREAQNVGYAIPVNDLKIVLPDLYKTRLLRKPFLGVMYSNASEALTEYLGNPLPGGCYIVEVVKDSTLYKAGVKAGDMLYAIDGHQLDLYGEMQVPWSEDRITAIDYVSRLQAGQNVHLVVYRKGDRKEFNFKLDLSELPPIRKIYPGYEEIDYEVFGGMVIMQLTLNHIMVMEKMVPGLSKYVEMKHQTEPVLVITHIFADSQIYRSRTVTPGSTINEVNGKKVTTLTQLRDVLKESVHDKFLTLRASDNLTRISDNILVVLPWDKILNEEPILSRDYHYPLSETAKLLLTAHMEQKQIGNGALAVPVS